MQRGSRYSSRSTTSGGSGGRVLEGVSQQSLPVLENNCRGRQGVFCYTYGARKLKLRCGDGRNGACSVVPSCVKRRLHSSAGCGNLLTQR